MPYASDYAIRLAQTKQMFSEFEKENETMETTKEADQIDLEREGAFKKSAIRLYREWQARIQDNEKEAQIERTRETREAFIKCFGIGADSVEGRFAYIDGIKLSYAPANFGYDYSTQEHWYVYGTCPNCHEELHSPSCHGLEDIGHYVAEFRPDYTHFCQANNSQPADESPEARLLSAIKDLIYQAMPPTN